MVKLKVDLIKRIAQINDILILHVLHGSLMAKTPVG